MFSKLLNAISRCQFQLATTKRIFLFLVVLCVATQAYPIYFFSLNYDAFTFLYLFLSIIFSLMFYILAYFFGILIKFFYDAFYKKPSEDVLGLCQILFFTLFVVIVVKEVLFPDLPVFKGMLNNSLASLFAYYGIANSCYLKGINPFKVRQFKTDEKLNDRPAIIKTLFFMTLFSCIFLIAEYFKNTQPKKEQIYHISVDAISADKRVIEKYSEDFKLSFFVESHGDEFQRDIRYIISGNSNNAVVNVSAEYTDIRWKLVSLNVKSSNHDALVVINSAP